MGFQDDWMMRQIEMMTRFVANVVFGKKESEVRYEIVGNIDDSDSLTGTDILHLELMKLIRQGEYCKAEDMLFDIKDSLIGSKEYTMEELELIKAKFEFAREYADKVIEAAEKED